MSQSFIISNVPANVSDITLLRFIREKSDLCDVKHIQPFPDAYHHINDKSHTKSMQLFYNDEGESGLLRSLFEGDEAVERLVHLENADAPVNFTGHIIVA